MPRKRAFVASLNEVHITREGDGAVIEYADPDVWTTHFTIGPEVRDLTDDEDRNPTVEIDGRELTWEQFGKMVVVNAGWGFRLCIVPDDETHERPTIVVRDSDDADA